MGYKKSDQSDLIRQSYRQKPKKCWKSVFLVCHIHNETVVNFQELGIHFNLKFGTWVAFMCWRDFLIFAFLALLSYILAKNGHIRLMGGVGGVLLLIVLKC